jgi:hypothetical protein
MNGFCRRASAPVQSPKFKHAFENGAMPKSSPRNKKESTMMRKFAAALIATALVAGPALAQSTGNPTAAPAAPAVSQGAPAAAAKPAVKTAKTVKHSRHLRKHAARHIKKHAAVHQAHRTKASKVHHAGAAKTGKQS